ncbi:MAG TPA: SPFH domain-containing protein, partial [Syntrophorhabdaceae bacterium]|nr:SPFH domain-containing protein [Syntrophorhabdaceae bacterium]
ASAEVVMSMLVNTVIVALIAVFFLGIRIVKPTHRGVIERLGKYNRFLRVGFNWVIPIIESTRSRNVTERMTNIASQEIITKDNLNAKVELVVYHKVKDDEESVKKSYYEVDDYKSQIVMLAQTTARNVIGNMKFTEVNSQRAMLNKLLAETIDKEIENWGLKVVRVELKDITPPQSVQETMNNIIQAQNAKDAAIDFATAVETKADGARRAAIKEADGIKQANILKAEGEARAIQLVNEAAERYFIGNAQKLRQLEMMEKALKDNAKIVITREGIDPSIIIGDLPIGSK